MDPDTCSQISAPIRIYQMAISEYLPDKFWRVSCFELWSAIESLLTSQICAFRHLSCASMTFWRRPMPTVAIIQAFGVISTP